MTMKICVTPPFGSFQSQCMPLGRRGRCPGLICLVPSGQNPKSTSPGCIFANKHRDSSRVSGHCFFRCTDKELAHVGRLSQIDTLSLPGARVSDTGLANLARLKRLETLNLWGNKITDAGLVHIKGLHKLRWLCLDQTAVTDSGLMELTGLTNLQTLSLEKTLVTDAGVQELQNILPKLKIIR